MVLTNQLHVVLYFDIYTRLGISMLSKYPKTVASNINQVLFVSFDVLHRSTIMARVRINKVQFSLSWINIFMKSVEEKDNGYSDIQRKRYQFAFNASLTKLAVKVTEDDRVFSKNSLIHLLFQYHYIGR